MNPKRCTECIFYKDRKCSLGKPEFEVWKKNAFGDVLCSMWNNIGEVSLKDRDPHRFPLHMEPDLKEDVDPLVGALILMHFAFKKRMSSFELMQPEVVRHIKFVYKESITDNTYGK